MSFRPYATVLAVAAALMPGLSARAQQPAGAPVKVGVLVSVTGAFALIGRAQRESYLLAQKVVNERGGVNGRPLQLMIEDDGSNPDTAVTKVNQMVSSGAVAVLGPTGLAATVATGGITSQKGLPQLATAGIALPAERERKCVFHMMPAQQINAAGLLTYAADAAKAKRVAVLYDSGIGQAVMNVMKDIAPQYGVNFVAAEKYDLTATDMSSQAAKVKAASPDLVLVVATSPTPFRNLRQLKVAAPMVATLATALYDTVKAMGDSAEGVTFVEYLVAENPRPREAEFVELFKAEYNKLPKNFEAAAWESVMVATKALRQVPTAEPDKLCASIRTRYSGAHTDYDFGAADMTGIRLSSFVYSRVQDGKFVRLPFTARDRE